MWGKMADEAPKHIYHIGQSDPNIFITKGWSDSTGYIIKGRSEPKQVIIHIVHLITTAPRATPPHPTTTPSIPQPHPTPYLPHARALSTIAFNFIFDPNFKDFWRKKDGKTLKFR